MIPVLFEKTEYEFASNGLGRLSDAISCIVTEERNGQYELAMEYPEGGVHASDLETDRIIWCKPAVYETEQPFRIYKITKTLNKRIKVQAQHISYDLAYTTVMPCAGALALDSLITMTRNAINIGHFEAWSDVSTPGPFIANEPASFRNWIGGRKGSILEVFGGELQWDGFTVKLHANRGRNRGLELRYGKNIADISQEQDIDYTITGITPYLVDSQKKTLTLPEKTIWKSGVTYTPRRDKSMNMHSYVDEKAIREDNPTDTEEQIETKLINAMRTATQAYVDANITGTPDAAIEVSYVDLGSTEEYKDWKALYSQAGLCDTVSVYYERLGIATTSKIVKTEYNVLLERFEKLTIGKTSASLASNIYGITKDQKKAEEETKGRIDGLIGNLNIDIEDLGDEIEETAQNLQDAIEDATELITGSKGGYVVIDTDASGKPYQILIMDKATKQTATKVWRWNKDGLGYSSTGYSGTYGLAITANGAIVADYITTGNLSATLLTAGILNASLIKTGVLTDNAGKNWWNMSAGSFSFCNGNMFYTPSDGNYIQLQNDLSLRFNGVPLAGRSTNIYVLNPSSGAKLGGTIALVLQGSGTIDLVKMQVIQYPYMTVVSGYVSFSSVTANDSILYLFGLPSYKDATGFGQGQDYIGHRDASSITPMTVYLFAQTPADIMSHWMIDYYKAPPSGLIGALQINLTRSTSSARYYFSIVYGSEAETVEYK